MKIIKYNAIPDLAWGIFIGLGIFFILLTLSGCAITSTVTYHHDDVDVQIQGYTYVK